MSHRTRSARMRILIAVSIVIVIIFSGCVQTTIKTKEDSIYNPPTPRGNETVNTIQGNARILACGSLLIGGF